MVADTRRREAPHKQIPSDFGNSHAIFSNWLRHADIADGNRPGVTREQFEELREANRRIRMLEKGNAVLRRAVAYLSRSILPKWCSRGSETLPPLVP